MRALAQGLDAQLDFKHDSLGVCARLVKLNGTSDRINEVSAKINSKAGAMAIRLDDRTKANMDVAMENVCRDLPHNGGDHETRKYIAKKLLQATKKGETTLGALESIGRSALQALSDKK
jgi:hypothetical protein